MSKLAGRLVLGLWAALLLAQQAVFAAGAPESVPASFRDLVAGVGLSYSQPEGFSDTPVLANPLWAYEHAVHSPEAGMEIRYVVRPIERMRIAYSDPHSNAPEPNHIFPMLFQTLIGLLSDGKHTPSREYPPQQARAKFNAEWAAAALFDVDRRFATEHALALMVAMHKSDLADAYVIYLFDDYAKAKPLIDAGMGSLRFLP